MVTVSVKVKVTVTVTVLATVIVIVISSKQAISHDLMATDDHIFKFNSSKIFIHFA